MPELRAGRSPCDIDGQPRSGQIAAVRSVARAALALPIMQTLSARAGPQLASHEFRGFGIERDGDVPLSSWVPCCAFRPEADDTLHVRGDGPLV